MRQALVSSNRHCGECLKKGTHRWLWQSSKSSCWKIYLLMRCATNYVLKYVCTSGLDEYKVSSSMLAQRHTTASQSHQTRGIPSPPPMCTSCSYMHAFAGGVLQLFSNIPHWPGLRRALNVHAPGGRRLGIRASAGRVGRPPIGAADRDRQGLRNSTAESTIGATHRPLGWPWRPHRICPLGKETTKLYNP